MASAAAKVLTGIGAAILLASGGCFLFLGDALRGGGAMDPTLLSIVIVLVVAGVIALTALLGMLRERPE